MSRFSQITTARIQLKNRVVVPPMASQTATLEGIATKATFEHYNRLAQSGAGLIIVEYSFVHPTGRSEAHQLGVHADECIPGLKEIASLIHQHGAKAGVQLTHCGGKSSREVCPQLMAPSGIIVPTYDRVLPKPQTMTVEDIKMWRASFVTAALRVEQAGFDFVELHCAHGYGLNQILSPITNKRDDQYGGSLVNRTRLIVEIIESIKESTQLGVMVRIPGQDLYAEGLSQSDMVSVTNMLVKTGVDIIDVSSGIGGWNRPKNRRGEGYLVKEAAHLKAQGVKVPIIGVGGIETAEYIEQALAHEWLDLAAVGRAILSDPVKFRQKIMQEETPVPHNQN